MVADTPQGAPAMNTTGMITMTMREVDRYTAIQDVADRVLMARLLKWPTEWTLVAHRQSPTQHRVLPARPRNQDILESL